MADSRLTDLKRQFLRIMKEDGCTYVQYVKRFNKVFSPSFPKLDGDTFSAWLHYDYDSPKCRTAAEMGVNSTGQTRLRLFPNEAKRRADGKDVAEPKKTPTSRPVWGQNVPRSTTPRSVGSSQPDMNGGTPRALTPGEPRSVITPRSVQREDRDADTEPASLPRVERRPSSARVGEPSGSISALALPTFSARGAGTAVFEHALEQATAEFVRYYDLYLRAQEEIASLREELHRRDGAASAATERSRIAAEHSLSEVDRLRGQVGALQAQLASTQQEMERMKSAARSTVAASLEHVFTASRSDDRRRPTARRDQRDQGVKQSSRRQLSPPDGASDLSHSGTQDNPVRGSVSPPTSSAASPSPAPPPVNYSFGSAPSSVPQSHSVTRMAPSHLPGASSPALPSPRSTTLGGSAPMLPTVPLSASLPASSILTASLAAYRPRPPPPGQRASQSPSREDYIAEYVSSTGGGAGGPQGVAPASPRLAAVVDQARAASAREHAARGYATESGAEASASGGVRLPSSARAAPPAAASRRIPASGKLVPSSSEDSEPGENVAAFIASVVNPPELGDGAAAPPAALPRAAPAAPATPLVTAQPPSVPSAASGLNRSAAAAAVGSPSSLQHFPSLSDTEADASASAREDPEQAAEAAAAAEHARVGDKRAGMLRDLMAMSEEDELSASRQGTVSPEATPPPPPPPDDAHAYYPAQDVDERVYDERAYEERYDDRDRGRPRGGGGSQRSSRSAATADSGRSGSRASSHRSGGGGGGGGGGGSRDSRDSGRRRRHGGDSSRREHSGRSGSRDENNDRDDRRRGGGGRGSRDDDQRSYDTGSRGGSSRRRGESGGGYSECSESRNRTPERVRSRSDDGYAP